MNENPLRNTAAYYLQTLLSTIHGTTRPFSMNKVDYS